MHKYERFIIYPLLILALFYGMAGNQVMTSAQKVYDEIVTKDIKVVNNQGEEVLRMGVGTSGNGLLTVYDNDGEELIYLGAYTYNGEENGKESAGLITVSNKYNETVIGLGITKPDEDGHGGNHGVIAVFDRYGENPASYGHSSY